MSELAINSTKLSLFPFHQYWWAYGIFSFIIILLLVLDLGVFHRRSHEVRFREALCWSIFWVMLAICFGVVLYFFTLSELSNKAQFSFNEIQAAAHAKKVFIDYITGLLLEKSLSVDNLFVFLVIFNYFKIPRSYQHNVLFYGILGAFIFRGIFIGLGSALLVYPFVMVLFGLFLIFTGLKMFFANDETLNPDDSWVLGQLKKYLPLSTDLQKKKYFVRIDGKLHITPLF